MTLDDRLRFRLLQLGGPRNFLGGGDDSALLIPGLFYKPPLKNSILLRPKQLPHTGDQSARRLLEMLEHRWMHTYDDGQTAHRASRRGEGIRTRTASKTGTAIPRSASVIGQPQAQKKRKAGFLSQPILCQQIKTIPATESILGRQENSLGTLEDANLVIMHTQILQSVTLRSGDTSQSRHDIIHMQRSST